MAEARERLSPRRVAIIVAAAVVVGVLVWPFLRPRLLGPRTAASAYRYAAQAQVVAGGFAYARLADAPEFDRAAESLIAAETSRQAQPADPNDWPAAVRLALDFLRVCSTGDASAYERWAHETQGKVLPPKFPTWGQYRPEVYAERYEAIVGTAMPAEIRPDEYFRQYFETFWRRGNGEMRPDAVATDPQAVEVKTARFTHWGDSIGFSMRRDGLGPLFWYGGIGGGAIPFLWQERALSPHAGPNNPPDIYSGGPSYDSMRLLFADFIERYGAINAVRVYLVYRGTTGVYIPANFLLIQRPNDGRWEMIDFIINNIGDEVGVGTNPGVPIF